MIFQVADLTSGDSKNFTPWRGCKLSSMDAGLVRAPKFSSGQSAGLGGMKSFVCPHANLPDRSVYTGTKNPHKARGLWGLLLRRILVGVN